MSRIINDMSFHLVLKNCRPHLVCRCQKQNSKFIPITTGLDPEKHTFKKVENFTVDSPSKNQLIDKVWDLQTIKRIKYQNLKIKELRPPQGQCCRIFSLETPSAIISTSFNQLFLWKIVLSFHYQQLILQIQRSFVKMYKILHVSAVRTSLIIMDVSLIVLSKRQMLQQKRQRLHSKTC